MISAVPCAERDKNWSTFPLHLEISTSFESRLLVRFFQNKKGQFSRNLWLELKQGCFSNSSRCLKSFSIMLLFTVSVSTLSASGQRWTSPLVHHLVLFLEINRSWTLPSDLWPWPLPTAHCCISQRLKHSALFFVVVHVTVMYAARPPRTAEP